MGLDESLLEKVLLEYIIALQLILKASSAAQSFFLFFFSSIFYISRYCCGLVMVSGPLPGMKLLVMADR